MQCSKSERSNNKLTRTTTPPNTSHSIFENRCSGGLQKSQQLGNYLCEFSPPAVTTDSFRKDIAKKLSDFQANPNEELSCELEVHKG
eukprot:symbB.v1.2.019295.t1/scaffold1554.1/size111945/1